MEILVDDVGSFPLPAHVNRESFNKAYRLARDLIVNGGDAGSDEFLVENFYQVVINSFLKKVETGLDVVNYPQHYDMHRQFLDVLEKSIEQGTYLVKEKDAVLPEVQVIKQEAKRLSEKLGRKLQLRVCVTGPLELYLRQVGSVAYREVLCMFADGVRRFAKNSVLNSKYVETIAVSVDEPSLGFQEITADRNVLLQALEIAFDFKCAAKQIHLHSPSRLTDVLEVRNVDVLSFEYAASAQNIESVPRKLLDSADKQIRVGVSRTDIDSITAELHDKGITRLDAGNIVESEEIMRKRYATAKKKYGDRMTFSGPDCGLGGWPTQEAAELLLKRTVNAVKSHN